MDDQMKSIIERELAASRAAVSAVYEDSSYRDTIFKVATVFIDALKAGQTLLFAGNGGSAADAQHIAGELVSRFYFDRPGLSAIALTTDTSILTCVGNDYGFERLFARQIEALGRQGDVFCAISTSGHSPNILAGITAAKAKGLTVIGMTGRGGGKMADMCDIVLRAPADITPRIQECHFVTYHLICTMVEEAMFGHLKP